MTTSLAEKIKDPCSIYDSPKKVLTDESLDQSDKLKVLKSMELDAKLISVATAEGMDGNGDINPYGLPAIKEAILSIDSDSSDQTPTDKSEAVGNANKFPYRRILVALETDDNLIDEILSTAIELSHEANATIRFLTIVPEIPVVVGNAGYMTVVDPVVPHIEQQKLVEESVKAKQEKGRDILEDFAPVGDSRHVVRRGVLVDEIVKYAEEWPADLLVMGAHNQNWFERLFRSKASSQVVDHVHCAVLIVPELK